MASGQVATITLPSTARADSSVSQKNVSDALTEEGRFELEQCRKIVQLRDEILAGKHPRIKLPPHLAAKAAATSAQKPSPPTLLPASQVYRNLDQPSRQANIQAVGANAAVPVSVPAGASASTPAPKAFATGRTQIDPVLLEKSDHLIRAELGLQRQKIERALREEADHKKVGAQAEPPEELDVSDILAKALALVQPTTVPPATGAVDPANAAAEEDTSFDENDYYSSNHESLDSHDSPVRVEKASGTRRTDAQSGISHVVPTNGSGSPGSRPVQPPNGLRADHQQYAQPEPLQQPLSTYHVTPSSRPSRPPSVGANDNHPYDKTVQSAPGPRKSARLHSLQNTSNGEASRYDSSARMEVDRELIDNGPGQQLAREAEYASTQQRGPPGLTSTYDTAPIPSPATHASSPASGARPPHLQAVTSTSMNAPRGAPAQVAALRNEHQGPSSPESSSPHGKGSAQRKCKKKSKRKADRLAQDAGPAPYIKTEPRSPSPLSGPANIRPAKRQKHMQRPDADTTFAQPQPQGPARPDIYQLAGPQPVERAPAPVTYGRYAVGAPDASPVYGGQGYERVYHDDAQPGMEPPHRGHYHPQAYSPSGYPVQYVGEEYGPTRSVSYREPARYYRDDYARHAPEPAMVSSQRPPLARVMVDSFGREYYEPSHPQPARQSVAPTVRPGDADIIYEGTAPVRHSVAPQMLPRDSEVIYERTGPARAMSRLPPGPESYEEGGVVYRRVSPPPYPVPRRVVTQPEYGAPEHAGYHRAYSVRPMGPPPDDYTPGPERRPVDGVLRQYPGRSASARPLEPVRYNMSADGAGHMQAAMPDGAGADYGMPRPQSRVGTMGPPAVREYAPRSGEPVDIQRPYSTRPPAERYYGEPQPMGEEAAYVERPPQHGVVYAEPRRDVYR